MVNTVKRSFECVGLSFIFIAVYLECFHIFCHDDTPYIQLVYSSEKGLKLTYTYDNVKLQKFPG